MRKRIYMGSEGIVAIAFISIIYFTTADAQKAAPKETVLNVSTCYGCHDEIKDFHAKGKHRKVI